MFNFAITHSIIANLLTTEQFFMLLKICQPKLFFFLFFRRRSSLCFFKPLIHIYFAYTIADIYSLVTAISTRNQQTKPYFIKEEEEKKMKESNGREV